MNWMTSGRHRALRSKRGKKRAEMHFPAHVQQREQARLRRHPMADQSSSSARVNADGGDAWYIRPVMDSNESHDIQMLELSRQGATASTDHRAAPAVTVQPVAKTPIQAVNQNDSSKNDTGTTLSTAIDRRCVFTPPRSNRPRHHLPSELTHRRSVANMTSPPPQELLLFNEGEQLAKPSHAEGGYEPTNGVIPGRRAGPVSESSVKETSSRWDGRSSPTQRGLSFQQPNKAASLPFYEASSSSDDEEMSVYVKAFDVHPSCTRSEGSARLVLCDGKWKSPAPLDQRQTSPHNTPPQVFLSTPVAAEYTGFILNAGTETRFPSRFTAVPEEPQYHLSSSFQEQQVDLPFAAMMSQLKRDDANRDDDVDIRSSPAFDPRPYGGGVVMRGESSRHHPYEGYSSSRQQPPPPHRPLSAEQDSSSRPPSSPSSQGSLQLPPPVDWNKCLVAASHSEYQLMEPPIGGSISSDTIVTRRDEFEQAMLCSDRLGADMSTSTWTASRRTSAILSKISRGVFPRQPKEAVEVHQLGVLKKRLAKKEDMTVYLFTLVQCHRVDELIESQSPSGASIQVELLDEDAGDSSESRNHTFSK